MIHFFSCGLAVILAQGVPRAEEVEWRAASPASFGLPVTPAVVKEDPKPRVPLTYPRPPTAEPHLSVVEPPAPKPASAIRVIAVSEPPMTDAPKLVPPKAEPQKTEPPKAEPPKTERPKMLPMAEPIGPPRPASPPATDAPPMRTLNLIGEHCWGAEPAPVDPGRGYFFRAEYLMWFADRMVAPPLVTTATPPNLGFFGGPTTQVLYGNGPIGNSFHHGGRFSAGMWLDCEQTCGVDASYFFLGRSSEDFHADSTQFPVLTRPFFRGNQPNPQESGQLVTFPPGFGLPDVQGAIDVHTSTGLWGVEFNARECVRCCSGWDVGHRIDAFAGFRYLDLDDRVFITENLILGANNTLVPPLPAGTRVQVNDRFTTHNQFYGGQIGVRGEVRRDRFFLEGRYSVALGGTHQTLIIEGNQFVTPPGLPTQTFTGGLLALTSNIGRHTRGAFSLAPEITLNAGMQVTPKMRAFLGYNFLYWTNVLRASEQIDRIIDVTLVPNFVPPGVFAPMVPARPTVLFRINDFWAQGLQAGIDLRW